MSQFTDPLIVELIGKNLWKVYKQFEYHVGGYPSDEIITVPVGTTTDFASIPRLLWWLLSPVDKHGKAAVVHDFNYQTQTYTRKTADDIFREGLVVLEVKMWKVFCMYWAVRLFGWWAWWKHSRRLRNKVQEIQKQ